MAEVTAAAVKELREKTGLPLMECKRALQATGGDAEAAVAELRKAGTKVQETRVGRETTTGRIGIYTDWEQGVGSMVELRCESAPVAAHEEFIQLAQDLAQQLATGPGADDGEALLKQPSPSQPGTTLGDQKDELFNRIREVFKVGRIVKLDGACGGYAHHAGVIKGVLVQVEGGTPEAAKDVAMHIAAMNPQCVERDDVPPEQIQAERDILTEAARQEGKPENIIEKMIDGRMRVFFEQRVLVDQPFVKDDKQTVGKFAKAAGMTVKQFVSWEMKPEEA